MGKGERTRRIALLLARAPRGMVYLAPAGCIYCGDDVAPGYDTSRDAWNHLERSLTEPSVGTTAVGMDDRKQRFREALQRRGPATAESWGTAVWPTMIHPACGYIVGHQIVGSGQLSASVMAMADAIEACYQRREELGFNRELFVI